MPRSRKNNKKVVPKCDTHHTHTHIHRRPTTATIVGRGFAAAISVLTIGGLLFFAALLVVPQIWFGVLVPVVVFVLICILMCIEKGILARRHRLKEELERFSKDPEKVAAFWKGLPRE